MIRTGLSRIGLLLVALLQPVPACAADAPRVRLDAVEYRGEGGADGAAAFLGIPYAAPPTGARRWTPPAQWQAAAGERDATRFAPACMQNARMLDWYRTLVLRFDGDPAAFPAPRFDEDCLYLNVWTPSLRPAAPLPVIVWIHGGSNTGGWSHEPNYHGAALAREGVVVVTIAYRLGVFGFLSLPDLPQSNFGLLDQIAALAWVRDHIGAFGGDAARVTVAGESAGASDIVALIASPRAQGLFARAIVQSGGYVLQSRSTREEALAQGRALARAAGAADDAAAIATLRALGPDALQTLVDATPGLEFEPVVDGDTLLHAPVEAIVTATARVDLLAGSNADEWRMYLEPPLDEDGWLRRHAPGIERVLRAALANEPDPLRRMDLLETARLFVCPSLWLAAQLQARGARTWLYHFSRVREGIGGERIGSYHGAEIPYVFGTHDAWLPTTAQDRALGARMMRYWSRFAANGDPNGAGDPPWPAFTADSPRVMRLDVAPRALDTHPSASLCRALSPR